MRIRNEKDYRITPMDSDEIRRYKTLVSQEKIPGAHVLLPSVSLINFDEEKTPPLVREMKSLKDQLADIEKQIAEMED